MSAGRARRRKRRRRKQGQWTEAHARRLLWRAGFGATPQEAAKLARAGKAEALRTVLDGDGETDLRGPAPSAGGRALDRVNEFDHDVLWWLDRMVRTSHPLQERMTLFWHSHFATANEETPLMLNQNETLRRHALGRFDDLLRAVFLDSAMQLHLSVAGSKKDDPNENFARELFELYTLGVDNNYDEQDIREAARAFTGWEAVGKNGLPIGTRFEPKNHDAGEKTIFGQRGPWGWEDVLRLTLSRKGVAEHITTKLWAEFVGTTLPIATRRKLVREFQRSGRNIRTLVAAILRAPVLYDELARPDQVKSPVVFVAGLLRTNRWPVDRVAWARLLAGMGQRPFQPPSVAGWDGGAAWCSTAGFRARFLAAHEVLYDKGGLAPVAPGAVDPALDPAGHLASAKAAIGEPFTTPRTDKELRSLAAQLLARPAPNEAARRRNAEATQRALRLLLIAGPDNQLH